MAAVLASPAQPPLPRVAAYEARAFGLFLHWGLYSQLGEGEWVWNHHKLDRERYLALHPGGSEAEYAYYLIALCHFDQITDVGRDQATTENAKTALNDIIRRFPDSEYAKDARLKLDMVNDQLAGKEMTVGRWYLRSNQTLSAVNRFRNVVETYQTTSHTPEALHRLVEAYLTLGLKDQAMAAGATLGYNYPDSDWYRMSYRLLTNEGVDLEAISASERRTLIQRLIPGGK